jgi:hypothetical protein
MLSTVTWWAACHQVWPAREQLEIVLVPAPRAVLGQRDAGPDGGLGQEGQGPSGGGRPRARHAGMQAHARSVAMANKGQAIGVVAVEMAGEGGGELGPAEHLERGVEVVHLAGVSDPRPGPRQRRTAAGTCCVAAQDNVWRTRKAWPPMGSRGQNSSLFAGADGQLGLDKGQQLLAQAAEHGVGLLGHGRAVRRAQTGPCDLLEALGAGSTRPLDRARSNGPLHVARPPQSWRGVGRVTQKTASLPRQLTMGLCALAVAGRGEKADALAGRRRAAREVAAFVEVIGHAATPLRSTLRPGGQAPKRWFFQELDHLVRVQPGGLARGRVDSERPPPRRAQPSHWSGGYGWRKTCSRRLTPIAGRCFVTGQSRASTATARVALAKQIDVAGVLKDEQAGSSSRGAGVMGEPLGVQERR